MQIIQIAQFLPKHERDAIFSALCANQEAFQQPGLPGNSAAGALYLPLESNEVDIGSVISACESLSDRILNLLPTLYSTFDIQPFATAKLPLTFVNGLDGHLALPHADESGGRFKISILYYLHQSPKAFCGGDLEFYPDDPNSMNGHSNEATNTIVHEDNLLIAFPSEYLHGITEVKCSSNRFEDGRFAAVGFLGQ